MRISTEEARRLVQKGTAHMTCPPQRIPSDTVVDAPLLGNGDLGAVIAGDGAKQVFYLGKNDFWAQAHLGENQQQRRDRLLHKEGRRTGTHILAVGWLEVAIPQLEGCTYSATQDPYLAEVRADYCREDAGVRYTSYICAQRNILVVEVENTGAVALSAQFCTMPGIRDTAEIYGYADGIRGDSVWTEYPAEPQSLPGTRWVYTSIATDMPTVYTPERMVRKGGSFALEPGKKAHIVLAMLSDLDALDAQEEAYRLCMRSRAQLPALRESHRRWWEQYWTSSLVETGNDTLDGFYYASLYFLASAVRAGKVPPGLFGPWITSDRPKWTGSYTLNYNYESPFFCLYTSNRQELAESYIEPLLAIIPIGRLYAREKFGRPGICLPVEIGPWGTVCSALFHHQKTNAA
ncbi:MAG TPA: hypothetical protein PKE04_11070, partial [Clostridia bacterium]|nr:hypothetical protein [Clostridia bacterium]